MNVLWDSLEEVKKKIDRHQNLLLMLDFDGTLSPIAPTPDDAVMSDEMRDCLQDLSGKKNVYLAIVSGRQLENIKEKIGIPGIIYVGNHGFEKEIFGQKSSFSLSSEMEKGIIQIKNLLEMFSKKYPGSWVEDKNIVVGFHYRKVTESSSSHLAMDVENALEKFKNTFVVSKGKKIIEIKPNVQINKGVVVRELIETIKEKTGNDPLPFYIGDDTTDEDAFVALPNGITIHVGNAENSAAIYSLFDTEDVLKFLQWLLKNHVILPD